MKCRHAFGLVLLALATAASAESSFTLAGESRLPKWFTIPAGLTRSDVSVSMAYYITPLGRSATLKLRDHGGQKLKQVSASSSDLEPHSFGPRTDDYPFDEILTVDGIAEVIEHRRMEPVFYVTDDPSVRSKLGVRGSH